MSVRVRVAPSPTGEPHVGLAYVTLFNAIFARQHGGQLVLRIEDTDRTRFDPVSEKHMLAALDWLGLKWDEGPDKGGPYGPYRQSERLEHYRRYADQLVAAGKAYPCFCTAERLAEVREKRRQEGGAGGYDRACLSDLSAEERERRVAAGETHVIRLRVPDVESVSFKDLLRGAVVIPRPQIDDQVLLKSDGFPTYHLANVVDDHLMKITHVIRAEEWISSTPKHQLLYEAFGWETPVFVHLPLLRNADRSKISKRKNPVSLRFYQRRGILPAAMINFLGLMGWSPGDDLEKFDLALMEEKFRLEDVHLGGPVFDPAKLEWLNQSYIQQLSEPEFVAHLRDHVFSDDRLRTLYPLFRERLTAFDQMVEKSSFFFATDLDYSAVTLVPKGREPGEVRTMLGGLAERVETLAPWDEPTLEKVLGEVREELGWKPKDFFMPLRLVATGRKDSPPLVPTLIAIGREVVRYRLWRAQSALSAVSQ